ncbi:MAG TPA: hypothetical protein VIL36_21235, partial [Acidimicrobiales bacterium]
DAGAPDPTAPDPDADAPADPVADVDQRIERLVAAIEAGTPADLVAPRLRQLKAARTALTGPEPT